MIPTVTHTTPSKSRRRGPSFWSALTADGRAGANSRSDEYENAKTRPRRYGALAARGRTDYTIATLLMLVLYLTHALLARERGGDSYQGGRPTVGVTRARRIGPTDRDMALARTVRSKNYSATNVPKSFYGRAALLKDEAGFPSTPPLVLSSKKPKAYLMRNFLSPQECDHLMMLAKRELAPSTVVGDGGSSVASEIRTSAGMFLRKSQDATVREIEERIARLSGVPVDNGEGMQILRYDKGQKYDPHFDYFHDKVNPAPKRGGQRVATVLIYLVDTEEGGETTFPNGRLPENFEEDEPDNPFAAHIKHTDCAKNGIPVKSVRGDAILFFSMTKDGELDHGSLHGACPVIAGQKWTAVKWLRVAKFDGGFKDELPMIPLTRRTEREPCVDEWDNCASWARDGWCERNPEFMKFAGARDSHSPACPKSCGLCTST